MVGMGRLADWCWCVHRYTLSDSFQKREGLTCLMVLSLTSPLILCSVQYILLHLKAAGPTSSPPFASSIVNFEMHFLLGLHIAERREDSRLAFKVEDAPLTHSFPPVPGE